MNIETIEITALHPDPANARRHGQRNMDAITSSLARFGQQKPIVIDANNVIRAGNGTLAAAKSLGWSTVQCVRTDLIGVEATAFAITDNRTAELAEWDPDILAAALADPDLGDLSFDDGELDALLKRDATDADAALASASAGEGAADITTVGESFQLIVHCESEDRQKQLFEQLAKEGWSCRVLTL